MPPPPLLCLTTTNNMVSPLSQHMRLCFVSVHWLLLSRPPSLCLSFSHSAPESHHHRTITILPENFTTIVCYPSTYPKKTHPKPSSSPPVTLLKDNQRSHFYLSTTLAPYRRHDPKLKDVPFDQQV